MQVFSSRAKARTLFIPLTFVLPFLIFFGVFRLIPFLWGIYLSFMKVPLLGNSQWVWLGNYSRLLTDDTFWTAVRNTFLYTVGLLPLFWGAMLIAMLLDNIQRGKIFYRAIIFMPYVIPMAVHGIVFNFVFQAKSGLIAYLFNFLGLTTLGQLEWLSNDNLAIWVVTAVWIYVYMGYMMTILYAGLQDIPRQYYEAATMEGAGAVRQLTSITLPLLSNVLVYAITTGIILVFQIFPLVWIMTGTGYGMGAGGPANSTISLDLYVYQAAFRDNNLGYAAAMGLVMMVFTWIIALLPFKFLPEIRYD